MDQLYLFTVVFPVPRPEAGTQLMLGTICLMGAWEKAQKNQEEAGIFQSPYDWRCSPLPSWAPPPTTVRKHLQPPSERAACHLTSTLPCTAGDPLWASRLHSCLLTCTAPIPLPFPKDRFFWLSLKPLPLCDEDAALGPSFLPSYPPQVNTSCFSWEKSIFFRKRDGPQCPAPGHKKIFPNLEHTVIQG